MKTAVMFAGVDALDLGEHRKTVLTLAEVRARLAQAQSLLATYDPSAPDLVAFISGPDADFHANLPLKAFVCAIAQVGLFDQYAALHGDPDFLMGCSLGDTARTVCSGAVSFEEMVYGTYIFNTVGQTIQGGAIVCARSEKALTGSECREIEAEGLTIAVHQTPKHFLVSGPVSELERWVTEKAAARGYLIRPLYDKPLHSVHMSPALMAVKAVFGSTEPKPARVPMISCMTRGVITTAEELRADIEQNMIGTVHWWQTLKWMAEELGVRHFVNIGPAHTLIHFANRVPLGCQLKLEDHLAGDIGHPSPARHAGPAGQVGAKTRPARAAANAG